MPSWKLLLKEWYFSCFDDSIVVKIRELIRVTYLRRENHKQSYLSMQVHIGKSGKRASGEGSFSTDRRLKICFRSAMMQERFNNLTILNSHKERPDRLFLFLKIFQRSMHPDTHPPPPSRWPTLTRLALAPPVENLLRGPCDSLWTAIAKKVPVLSNFETHEHWNKVGNAYSYDQSRWRSSHADTRANYKTTN